MPASKQSDNSPVEIQCSDCGYRASLRPAAARKTDPLPEPYPAATAHGEGKGKRGGGQLVKAADLLRVFRPSRHNTVDLKPDGPVLRFASFKAKPISEPPTNWRRYGATPFSVRSVCPTATPAMTCANGAQKRQRAAARFMPVKPCTRRQSNGSKSASRGGLKVRLVQIYLDTEAVKKTKPRYRN